MCNIAQNNDLFYGESETKCKIGCSQKVFKNLNIFKVIGLINIINGQQNNELAVGTSRLEIILFL